MTKPDLTNLDDSIECVMSFAMWTKEKYWAKNNVDGNMMPTVFACRDNKPVMVVAAQDCDKLLGLQIAGIIRKGTASDVITLITDTFAMRMSDLGEMGKLKEKTGYETMQEFWQAEPVEARKVMTECITLCRMTDTGSLSSATLPYVFDNGVVTWSKEDKNFGIADADNSQPVETRGLIPSTLLKIMNIKPISLKEIIAGAPPDIKEILNNPPPSLMPLTEDKLTFFSLKNMMNCSGMLFSDK